MEAELVHWSLLRQQHLEAQLLGPWAEDVWLFPGKAAQSPRRLCFTLTSAALKTEFKFALWCKFATGGRSLESGQASLLASAAYLMRWLNQLTPPIGSLLERSLESWEQDLRKRLAQSGQLKEPRQKQLLATQEYTEYAQQDRRIRLLRYLYHTVYDAYDPRPETDRDLWHIRRLGVAANLTRGSDPVFNFTLIPQPWLRSLAKEFIKYSLAVFSLANCNDKLVAIRSFASFLIQHYPAIQRQAINREVIVDYLTYLNSRRISPQQRLQLLSHLRLFLETSAYQLHSAGLPRERLIFNEDFPKAAEVHPRELPEEVLEQMSQHLAVLPPDLLRMVVILLECGMRISELCTLPIDCLTYDNKHEWYLRLYQSKSKKELVIPLVNAEVIAAIQSQQLEIKAAWGQQCPYLFPSRRSPELPFSQDTFQRILNQWALAAGIQDRTGKPYHFQSHQFRHTVGMRLLNADVPIDTIRQLLGHSSIKMTERYARKRAEQVREELQRTALRHKTVNYHGEVVQGDPAANTLDVQLLRKGIRGQTLPLGGCGRLIVTGPCEHENKCLTCPFWLTSTEDLPGLKAFHRKALQLRQRAAAVGNHLVLANQERILPLLHLRITRLEEASSVHGALTVVELLSQLRAELAELEVGIEEAREAQLVIAVKQLEGRMAELREQIAALEGTP